MNLTQTPAMGQSRICYVKTDGIDSTPKLDHELHGRPELKELRQVERRSFDGTTSGSLACL